MTAGRGRTSAALHVRNFRLYFAGQVISSVGTWMHQVAESWLVLSLTGNGFAVGLVAAARFLPVLTLGLWGGAIADRHDRRRVLYVSQSARALSAGVLAVLAFGGHATTVTVVLLAIVSGTANAVDNPVRRAFIADLVEPDLVLNAVSLNSTVMATSRVIGPLVAGGLIASIGVKWCFAINAVSYVAVLVMLAVMDAAAFRARRPAGGGGSIRDGLRYVASSHELLLSLSMVAVISTFAWNWETLLALHASETLDGGARLYTVMFAVLSVGTFIGALVNASRRSVTLRHLPATALGLGIAMVGVAVAPTIWLTLALLVATGVGASMFNTASNAVVQIAARGEYQGRVMAVFSALFVGTKGIGGAIAGALAQGFGSRVAIAVSAGGCLTAAAGGAAFSRPRPDVVTPPEPALPS